MFFPVFLLKKRANIVFFFRKTGNSKKMSGIARSVMRYDSFFSKAMTTIILRF